MADEGVTGPFLGFVADYKKLIAAMFGLATTDAVCQYVLTLGPPWPESAKVVFGTVIVAWLSLVWSFSQWRDKPVELASRSVTRFFFLTLFALFIYIACYSAFVVKLNTGDFLVGGFIESQDTIALKKPFNGKEGLTIDQILAGNLNDVKATWVPWSVDFARITLFVSWIVVFSAASLCLSAFLIQQERKGRAWGEKSREAEQPGPPPSAS